MGFPIIGLIFLLIGLVFKFFPPRRINRIYGWRTKFAMKNQETWDEAQRYGANLLVIFGFISVIIGWIVSVTVQNENIQGYLILAWFILICLVIHIMGELHLRKVFDKDGNRK